MNRTTTIRFITGIARRVGLILLPFVLVHIGARIAWVLGFGDSLLKNPHRNLVIVCSSWWRDQSGFYHMSNTCAARYNAMIQPPARTFWNYDTNVGGLIETHFISLFTLVITAAIIYVLVVGVYEITKHVIPAASRWLVYGYTNASGRNRHYSSTADVFAHWATRR